MSYAWIRKKAGSAVLSSYGLDSSGFRQDSKARILIRWLIFGLHKKLKQT